MPVDWQMMLFQNYTPHVHFFYLITFKMHKIIHKWEIKSELKNAKFYHGSSKNTIKDLQKHHSTILHNKFTIWAHALVFVSVKYEKNFKFRKLKYELPIPWLVVPVI